MTIREAILAARGRDYASDFESWGEIRKETEAAASDAKQIDKLLKEMWENIKDADSCRVYLGSLNQTARTLARRWLTIASMAEIALGIEDEEEESSEPEEDAGENDDA